MSALNRTIQAFTFRRLLLVNRSSTLQAITASCTACWRATGTLTLSAANSELSAFQSPRSSAGLASQAAAKEGKMEESGEAMSRSVGEDGRSERASSQKSVSTTHFHS